MEYLVLLFITEIFFLMISYFSTGRDILRPINVMLGMFCLSTFIALLNVFNWNIVYSWRSYFILSTGLLVALMADVFAYKKNDKKAIVSKRELKKIDISTYKIYFIILVELVILFLYYREIRRLAILDGYVDGANLLWHFRNITSYTSEESLRGIISLLIKFIDAVAYVLSFVLINNLFSKKIKKSEVVLFSIPILLFAGKVLMSSARMELLRWGAYSFVVSYILYKYKVGWDKNTTKRYVTKGLILIPVVLLLFYYASSIIGRSTTRSMFDYISTYAGGSIQHFNQYIDSPTTTEHFGEETFPAVYTMFKRIGLTDYSRPVHLEMRQLGVTQGNVYTFFRRPYNDFGYFGMLIFTFILIFFFSNVYSKFKYKHNSYRNDCVIIFYSYLFYWIVLSSVEQYSIGFVSMGTVLTLIYFRLLYFFFIQLKIQKSKIIIYKSKEGILNEGE